MKNLKFSIITCMCAIWLVSVLSCGKSPQADDIIINEMMASNRTGFQTQEGKTADWIEIKNTSADSINLKGFRLVVTKDSTSAKTSASGKEKDLVKEWSFPEIKIGGGECMVVFADKVKDPEKIKSLQANLKLPKEGGTVKLFSPSDKLLSEVKYSEMNPDESYALQADSTFMRTYWQSPGFENNRDGYESAIKEIDSQRKGPLLIWELMSRAAHSYENWVELKNVGDKSVNLSDYTIAKKPGKEEGWQLPAIDLEPGQIISIQLAGGTPNNNRSNLKAPFKLGDKETIILSKNGKFVDGMCGKLTPIGGSIGRKIGEKGFFFFSTPTRNAENSGTGYRYIAEKPEFDQKPGIYKGEVSLRMTNTDRKVHYTLDGSEPTMNSPVFKDSLVLSKPTVVRSFAEGDSTTMRSKISTKSYLVGVEHDLPVVNISLNREDFWDYNRGIYANGPGFEGGEFPYPNANFWKNWTKRAHIELFDGEKTFASDCGLKIFGGYSRALPKKSLRIKFRGQFGEKNANYDFFNTGTPMEFEDLVLRSGSQDYDRYMIKDEFFTSLVQSGSKSILSQMYRPVAVYVNAEYFGLYYLREKIDKNFVARKLNLPNDSIDVYLSGPSPYSTIANKIASLDMSKKENLEFAAKNIDLESLIDFKLGNIFAGKWDVGNVRHARSRHPESDKKWRYVYYDIDASWGNDGRPSAAFSLGITPSAINPDRARYNVVINNMLKSKEFRNMFLERLSYYLTNIYSTKNATAYFDKFIGEIRNEMKLNCKRWPKLSYEEWEKNLEVFRKKLEGRPQVILNDLRRYLSITEEENKKYFAHLGY